MHYLSLADQSHGFEVKRGARSAHPVEGSMMQPPCRGSFWHWQRRSAVSWVMPRLCPSSWATVEATPSTLTRWSCGHGNSGHGNSHSPDCEFHATWCHGVTVAGHSEVPGCVTHHVDATRPVLRAHGGLGRHAHCGPIKGVPPGHTNPKHTHTSIHTG